MLDTQVSRRTLLKSGGALVVSFSLAGPLTGAFARAAAAKPTSLEEVGTFLAIDRDNILTVYTGKTDLGTGIRMALMQMAAEELDMPIDQTRLVEGDTDLCPDQGPTWASLSVQVGGAQIRQAAATARNALLDMAADRLGASRDNLEARDGIVRVRGGGGETTWGELVDGQIIDLKVDKEAPVKPASEHRLVGKSIPRRDIPPKATGTFMYVQNVRLPGMVHARMVFPPGIGSELKNVDESSVADIPGLIAVVRRGSFLAVVAESDWAAIRARRQLKAEWSDWQGLPDSGKLYEHVRATPVTQSDVDGEKGDVDAALAQAGEKFSATYDFGIQVHGPIGPTCSVARVENGRITVWSPSQSPYWTRKEVAQILGVEEDAVHFIYAEGAGCFGRNGNEDCTVQAALIAREVGRPVRLQWMREDEHGWSPKGPPTLVDLEAGMDGGKVTAWRVNYYIPQQTALLPIENLAAIYAGVDHETVLNPGRIQNNAVAGYNFANAKAILHRLETTPFRPSWIRSPGRMQNTYAIEAFMDELAAAAKADPVEFRLAHLEDQRGAETLRAAVRRAGWQTRPSPKRDEGGRMLTGRGVAYARYESRTYVACVADVEVDRETGRIRVRRIVVGQDCGQMVNPDGVINQIEGQVIQTVSRTLMEEVTFDRSNVTSLNWESYPILRFPDIPEVVSELIVRQDQPPWGVGEMPAVVVPPAITNAVFDATGKRLRSVPFTPEKVLAALKA